LQDSQRPAEVGTVIPQQAFSIPHAAGLINRVFTGEFDYVALL